MFLNFDVRMGAGRSTWRGRWLGIQKFQFHSKRSKLNWFASPDWSLTRLKRTYQRFSDFSEQKVTRLPWQDVELWVFSWFCISWRQLCFAPFDDAACKGWKPDQVTLKHRRKFCPGDLWPEAPLLEDEALFRGDKTIVTSFSNSMWAQLMVRRTAFALNLRTNVEAQAHSTQKI